MKCIIRAPSEARAFPILTPSRALHKDMALVCSVELEPSPRVTREGAPLPSTSLLHPPGGHRGPGHGKQNPGLLPVGTERQGSFVPLYPLGDHPTPVACSRQVPGDWRDDASEIGVVCQSRR